jgi:hypothetical protein
MLKKYQETVEAAKGRIAENKSKLEGAVSALANCRAILELKRGEFKEARIQAALDDDAKPAVKNLEKVVDKAQKETEEAEILFEALQRRSKALDADLAATQTALQGETIRVILMDLEILTPRYNECLDTFLAYFQRVAVAVKAIRDLKAERELKAVFPELLQFPLPVKLLDDYSATNLNLLKIEATRTGDIKRIIPFMLSAEAQAMILKDILHKNN